MLGITIEDLPAIQRAEFHHYLSVAERELGETPGRCPAPSLVEAVCAAFGLDTDAAERDERAEVLALVEDIRTAGGGWDGFADGLWARRHQLRPDMA